MIDTDIARPYTYRAAFHIGQVVYLRVRPEPIKGMVTSICFSPSGEVYFIGWPDGEDDRRFAIELTDVFIPDYEADDP